MAQIDNHKLKATDRYWLEHLEAWAGSGLSMVGYAKQQGLNHHSFSSGKARLERRGYWPPTAPTASDFVRVQVAAPMGAEGHRLHLGEGVVLELAAHCPATWVAEVVRALREMR